MISLFITPLYLWLSGKVLLLQLYKIQQFSKSQQGFELDSGFRAKPEDCLQKENKLCREFWCPSDWLLEAFQVSRSLSQEVSARLWHLQGGCSCCITSGASLSLTYCRAATISCTVLFSTATLISAFLWLMSSQQDLFFLLSLITI